MKIATHIAGVLLGLLFVIFSSIYLLNLLEPPPLPEGSPMAHFMAVFAATGYLTFVKLCELLGGILVAIPKTRNFGLLILGPIIVNIVAFHVFISGPGNLADPILIVICMLTAFLLWSERRAFLGLLR